jgi:WD40 repeat protein
MNLQEILNCLFPAILGLLVTTLEHEKSFLVQESASIVQSIAIYGDSLLLTVSNDVVQKDIQTGTIQRTFRAHTNAINNFVLTDDHRMVTTAYDDMIIVWSLESGSVIKRISLRTSSADIQCVFFQENTVFVGGMDRTVRHVDIISGKILRSMGMV